MADKGTEKDEKPIVVAKNAAELQKIRLEKLMNNPVINLCLMYFIYLWLSFSR